MDSLDTSNWDPIDYSSLFEDITPTDHYWGNQSAIADTDASLTVTLQNRECIADIDASLTATLQDIECAERECPRKRGRNDSCSRMGTKACRERLRREKLNERFAELSSILEPGRPARTDKLAIIGDAIRVLNQLKTESQEYKEANAKLLEEIKTLKVEKNELREEKQLLKSDKEKLEQQLKVMPVSHPGYMPAHPAAYHAGPNKMPVFPNYGLVPMWQYLPPSARDTSCDHELRPPAA